MSNPYVTVNSALQDAPFDQHEQILRDLFATADGSDHALSILILCKLVELLSARLGYVETQAQGCADALAHHGLDS